MNASPTTTGSTTSTSTSTATSIGSAPRDYALTGAASRRAVQDGLADAQWYRPAVSPERMQVLMARSNGRAAFHTVLWLALLAGSGALAFQSSGRWWAIPAFAAYGALYGGAADPRWHECGHGTAFKSRWANDVVYTVASFMLLREPTMWRWSHVRHHSDTIIVGRDPEISFPRPFKVRVVLANYLHLLNGPAMLRRMVRHAFGSIDDDARDFVPEDDLPRVVWEARIFVAILAGVIAWSVLIGSIVPLLFIGLPSFYGVWLLWFFAVTQHGGLREDVLDHRLNTRTVYINPVFRFLYLNMNYHLEHHLFPSVPYHHLPQLHAEIKHHLPPPKTSMFAAYREIVLALRRQHKDPTWELPLPVLPADAPAAVLSSKVTSDVEDPEADAVDIGAADMIETGRIVRLDLNGRTYALCRPTADLYALTDGLCTHGQTHLAEGFLDGCTIECPKHNGRFDVRTGEPLRKPVRIPLATYEIERVGGRLMARLDGRRVPPPPALRTSPSR